jgi:hypothetical protein
MPSLIVAHARHPGAGARKFILTPRKFSATRPEDADVLLVAPHSAGASAGARGSAGRTA